MERHALKAADISRAIDAVNYRFGIIANYLVLFAALLSAANAGFRYGINGLIQLSREFHFLVRHPDADQLVRQQLQRVPGSAMVHVRRHGAVRRGLDAEGQRARPRRPGLRHGQRPRARSGSICSAASVPDADVHRPDVFHLAVVRRRLVLRRGLDQRRRPGALAGEAGAAGRLWAGRAARRLRNHQVHRGADRSATSASTPTRSRCNDRFRHPQHGAADVRRA